VVFVEEWSDKAALDAHFQQEAFQNFFATMSQLWQNEPDIRIFEAQRMG
jgi:quinol monooxygenase YgiN